MKRQAMDLKNAMQLRAIAIAVAASWAASAGAFVIESDNPDLSIRWDNSIRVNGGVRVEGRDSAITSNPAFDESDYKFDKSDMYAKRVDLLSEFDIGWKRRFGVRLSGSAWYDHAYNDDKVIGNPAFAALGTSYDNARYSSFTNRYHNGLSGEILDAFAWANLEAGEMPVSIKAGRFSSFWGNSLFFAGGIARGQQPIDGRKAASVPGSEVKELFLPLTQLSVVARPNDAISITGQYYFDWENTRAPEGGTYFASSDFALDGPDKAGLPGLGRRADPLGPESKRGNFGVAVKISPEIFNGQTLGMYYRKYDEKTPWLFLVPGTNSYRTVYARDAELFGLGFDGKLGPVSVGAELGYHKNVGLSSRAFQSVTEGARGNTWHALVNGVYGLTPTPLWQTGTLVGELTYTSLDKVTKNEALMAYRVGAAGCKNAATGGAGGARDGCLTNSAWGIGVKLTPQYAQVFPGVDLEVPITVNYGLKGNSASAMGTSEGVVTYSVGVSAKIYAVHAVDLLYADQKAPMRVSAGGVAVGGNGAYSLNDRGRLSLTYKYAF